MNFKKVNNITGWIVCAIACTVYILTAEAGGSLWDCGEFVSSCFKLQIPHPPGAPLFVIIGRIFIVLFGDNPLTAAKAVNIMNALASGFTILFLFWTITHFARRIANVDAKAAVNSSQLWTIMGAGVVGALAYTFSDSFWFSAVEGEVYALSSFFTALVFWAILKWEHVAEEEGADKWIIFIFFMMGLSIGVHLLNLLTIPAIVLVYYFRKREKFNYALLRKWFVRIMIIGGVAGFILALIAASIDTDPQRGVGMDSTLAGLALLGAVAAIGLFYLVEKWGGAQKEKFGGAYMFLVLGAAITGVVQIGVIQYSIKGAGMFDRWFVNGLGLPFFTGFTIFFILLIIAIWFGLKLANKKSWYFLRLGIWCFVFMLIGYSTYLTTMIRSAANPSVDMYNVDNPMSLVGYLGREQYGDFPLLYGAKFNARPVGYKEGSMRYQKGKDKYVELGKEGHYLYAPEDKLVFPRVWDPSNEQNHADYYAAFLGLGQDRQTGEFEPGRPNQVDNFRFFLQYQINFMYIRYFMWNFAGKQNDIQGVFDGNVRDGNWQTGIKFLDALRLSDQNNLPDSMINNKANNKLYALPLILGLIGLFFHFKRKGEDAFVNLLLFFFTGFAIVLYLNQPGYQPRERDYAYVGSFYAFAVWIGLGVMQVKNWLAAKAPEKFAATAATLLCLLAVPTLMASQEWDDHDRSKKQLARDLAKDYLESCAPNAILFCFGDNDTYPLWYAQEVEGIRKDIRVINFSLLGIDWYINQLRYRVNESDAIDVIWNAEQIEGDKRNFVKFAPKPNISQENYYDLFDMMKNYVGSDDPAKIEDRGEGEYFNTFPAKKVSIPVNRDLVMKNGTVNANDSVVNEVRFEIAKQNLYKNDLAVLNIIAANGWKRPIYFTSPGVGLGFEQYIRRDGLSYRFIPVQNSEINTNWAKDKAMNVFGFGSADKKGVYFDEQNRFHLNTIRQTYAELAADLATKGRKEEARQVLDKCDKGLLEENMPYGMVSKGNFHNKTALSFLQACYLAEHKELAKKVAAAVKKDLQQQIKYYNSLSGYAAENLAQEKQMAESYIGTVDKMEQFYTGKLNPDLIIPGKTAPKDSNPAIKDTIKK